MATEDKDGYNSDIQAEEQISKTMEEYRVTNEKIVLGSGCVIIINNFKFSDAKYNLTGGENDTRRLKERFEDEMGFDVYKYENVSAERMQSILDKCGKKSLSNVDCFICCISTHGGNSSLLGQDMKTVQVDSLIRPIMNNKTLDDMPKMFFIDACRVSSMKEFSMTLPKTNPETLICYATSIGNPSHTSSELKGSVFIKAISDVLRKREKDDTIDAMIKCVSSMIARHYPNKNQVVQYDSTLANHYSFIKEKIDYGHLLDKV